MSNKWEDLKQYIREEIEKPCNSDDIPQCILNDVLDKMNELDIVEDKALNQQEKEEVSGIDYNEFLSRQDIELGTYALVTTNGQEKVVWFSKIELGDSALYLDHACYLYEIDKVQGDIDEFAREYAASLLEDEKEIKEHIEKYIKPMIVDGVYYDIEHLQGASYLPNRVEDIKIITERECLEFLVNGRG